MPVTISYDKKGKAKASGPRRKGWVKTALTAPGGPKRMAWVKKAGAINAQVTQITGTMFLAYPGGKYFGTLAEAQDHAERQLEKLGA